MCVFLHMDLVAHPQIMCHSLTSMVLLEQCMQPMIIHNIFIKMAEFIQYMYCTHSSIKLYQEKGHAKMSNPVKFQSLRCFNKKKQPNKRHLFIERGNMEFFNITHRTPFHPTLLKLSRPLTCSFTWLVYINGVMNCYFYTNYWSPSLWMRCIAWTNTKVLLTLTAWSMGDAKPVLLKSCREISSLRKYILLSLRTLGPLFFLSIKAPAVSANFLNTERELEFISIDVSVKISMVFKSDVYHTSIQAMAYM